MDLEHSWDGPLSILVAALVIKELFALVRYMMERMNGRRAGAENGSVTPNGIRALWTEVNRLRDSVDKVWEKLGEVSERLARLEPRK